MERSTTYFALREACVLLFVIDSVSSSQQESRQHVSGSDWSVWIFDHVITFVFTRKGPHMFVMHTPWWHRNLFQTKDMFAKPFPTSRMFTFDTIWSCH